MQVLIADDSPTIRGFVRLALRGLPIELVEAEDGAQGLERARQGQCVLALIDLQRPNVDGLTMLRALRAEAGALATLPVLVLSGERNEELRAQTLAAGAQGFVEKPLQLAALREAVQRLLPGSAP